MIFLRDFALLGLLLYVFLDGNGRHAIFELGGQYLVFFALPHETSQYPDGRDGTHPSPSFLISPDHKIYGEETTVRFFYFFPHGGIGIWYNAGRQQKIFAFDASIGSART